MSNENQVDDVALLDSGNQARNEQENLETNVDHDNEPEPPPLPKGVQKRIDELTRKRHDERRRADQLEQELANLRKQHEQANSANQRVDSLGAPDPSQYPAGRYDPDYIEAMAEYKVEQRFQAKERQAVQQQKQQQFATSEKEIAAKYPDYEDARADFQSHDLAKIPEFIEIIQESEAPAELAYFLGKNPEELDKIGNMTPLQASRYIGKLEAQLLKNTPSEPAKKPVSNAPKPIDPLTGGRATTGVKDPDKMNMDEYAAWRKSKQG